jgi:NADH-quinone oxidoreductase subunit L
MNWFDPNVLPWLVPIPPLLAFLLIILITGRSKTLSHAIAIGCIALAWLFSFIEYINVIQIKNLGQTVPASAIAWLPNGAGSGALNMGVMIDPLNALLLFMVPLACLLIFIYAVGYMAHDPRNTRFFAYLSLFAGAMLTLVVADNLLLLFIGWEIMGLCSYLLIGFWYEKPSAYRAAIKAFLTTRVGDVIMMIGIGYLWASTGTLSFRAILYNDEVLKHLATTPALGGFLGLTAASLIGICIVFGTIGKSAQFPLHVWLPDAMEGPTPVSAMIHAATMVSAGVYLVLRMYPIISAGGDPAHGILTTPMTLMAVVGGFTALFAATIAVAQNDIKKVLAYSTISQLGFMIAALGIGAYVAAAFHLITHAFFKALLFLGSGSVIHAMEHGEHVVHAAHSAHDAHGEHAEHEEHDAHGHDAQDEHAAHDAHDAHTVHDAPAVHEEQHAPAFDPQDMRNMGGLFPRIPITAITFIIGGCSLAGLPFITAGFWSKDEIFADAVAMSGKNPLGLYVLIMLALAAMLTAFYTFRQIAMTFLWQPRTEEAKAAIHNDGTVENRNIGLQMEMPLVVLAFFAIFAGFVGVNAGFPLFGGLAKIFDIGAFVGRTLIEAPERLDFNILPVLVSLTVFILGGLGAFWLYYRKPIVAGEADPVEGIVGADIYRILKNKYYIDEFYVWAFVQPTRWIADVLVSQIIDKGIIDGILHGIALGATWIGNLFREFNRIVIDGVGDGIPEEIVDIARSLRVVQTGNIQQYLLYVVLAVLVVALNVGVLVVAPNMIGLAIIVQVSIVVVFAFVISYSSTPDSK